jgi:hypothetical protein
VSREILKPEKAVKMNMPVLLLTGEESTDPAKAQVGAVAAALPDVQRLVLAGQQHIADILDPETFAKHLLGFLHGPTLHREPGAIVEVSRSSPGHSQAGPASALHHHQRPSSRAEPEMRVGLEHPTGRNVNRPPTTGP